MKISIETTVNAPLELVWQSFVTPQDIICWNFAIDEWCCPRAELELVVGGTFNYRMEAPSVLILLVPLLLSGPIRR